MRVAVVGAARRRQGTGEYVARELIRAGCSVPAIVTSSRATADEACASLAERYGIVARGYSNLDELLEKEALDAVAVCTPPALHRAHVERALRAGCHVLCEKPLFWDDALLEADGAAVEADALSLGRHAHDARRVLTLNTQWPFTLPAFDELHPGVRSAPVTRFDMLMGPTSSGLQALVDSLPHLLSMLHAVVGVGRVSEPRLSPADGAGNELTLDFGYLHACGSTDVSLVLRTTPVQPRPLSYAINGITVTRRLALPEYVTTLVDGTREMVIPDPLALSVSDFLARVRGGRHGADEALVAGMVALHALARATLGRPRAASVALSPIHDFTHKLLQPDVLPGLKQYVRWQAALRRGEPEGQAPAPLPEQAPLSVNLDLTTACNYRCDHCVDLEILNTGVSYRHQQLRDSLATLAERGLRSVIVIGGGEPTLYPGFVDLVGFMKDLRLQVGIVTNGSRLEPVAEVAGRLDARDWVRLSLDAGSDATFQAMHRPRHAITLDEICAHVPRLKELNPAPRIGFSFIVVWRDCNANDVALVDNIHEIVTAAERAKRHRFDYISFKPFLERLEDNHAETVGLARPGSRDTAEIVAEIRAQIALARALAGDGFEVIESTNLRVLAAGSHHDFARQPRRCHMQFFRQVLSPLGIYNCPVYRNVPHARLGAAHDYARPEGFERTQKRTLALIEEFDASHECRQVTCLYNPANWFIEELIGDLDQLERLAPADDRRDYYL